MSCADALSKPRPEAPADLKIVLVAAAALVDPDGRVLIAQRPEGKSMAGLWEFPGGKVNEGETPEFALMRELEEELGIETRPTCYLPIGFASHTYDDFHLLMPLFMCRAWKNVPRAREHTALKWVRISDLGQYPMPAADLPLIESLRLVI
jgi:8-oxo-dGTP diphosphatase